MSQGSLEPEQGLPQPLALSGRPCPPGHIQPPHALHGSCPWTALGSRSIACPLQRPYHFQSPGGSPQQSTCSVTSSGPQVPAENIPGPHRHLPLKLFRSQRHTPARSGKYCVAREQRRRSSVSGCASAAKWPCDLGTPCHLCHSVSPSATKPVGCVPSEAGWHCHQASSPEEGPSFWRP